MFSNPEPSPKNVVAVTELIPEIFVAVSPIIFPFALILPAKVDTPVVIFRVLKVAAPESELILKLLPLPCKSPLIITPPNPPADDAMSLATPPAANVVLSSLNVIVVSSSPI